MWLGEGLEGWPGVMCERLRSECVTNRNFILGDSRRGHESLKALEVIYI
jgi:hypothetical protein